MPKSLAIALVLLLVPLAAEARQLRQEQATLPRVTPVFTASPGLPDPRLRLPGSISERPPATSTLVLAGVLTSAVSAAGGAVLGYHMTRAEGGEDPGLTGTLLGWVLGPAVVTPGVVHLVNRGQGSGPAAYALAGLLAAVTLGTVDELPALFVASPAVQAAAAVLVQVGTDPRRH